MFIYTVNFFLKTKIVFMCLLPEPYIETQPEMFIPNYSIKESPYVDDSVSIDIRPLNNMLGMNFFSLGFSVNFRDVSEQPYLDISCLYAINKTKITLKRFCKKCQNVQQITGSKKPIDIILPDNEKEILSFRIFILKKLLTKGLLDLKSNALLILISTGHNESIITETCLREAIANFKNLFRIRPFNNPQYFSFQFCVEIPLSSMFVDIGIKPKLIYTYIFEIVFDDMNLTVKLNEVNPMDYYLD